jgi:hypothetical protein
MKNAMRSCSCLASPLTEKRASDPMSPSTLATMAGPSQTRKAYLRQSTPSIRMLLLTSTTTPQPFASTSKNFQVIRAKPKTILTNQVYPFLRTNTLNKMKQLSTSQSRTKKLLK